MQAFQVKHNPPTTAGNETTQHQQSPQGMHKGDMYDLKLEK